MLLGFCSYFTSFDGISDLSARSIFGFAGFSSYPGARNSHFGTTAKKQGGSPSKI